METQTKQKKKLELLRWNLERASVEFSLNPRTLSQRIHRAAIKPDKDGKFSTAQICAAVFGDIQGQRLRKTTAEADKIELDNARERGEVVELAQTLNAWEVAILNAKERFIRIPTKLTARYVVGMPQVEFTKLLEAEIDETCAELSSSAKPDKPKRKGKTT